MSLEKSFDCRNEKLIDESIIKLKKKFDSLPEINC